MESYNSIENIPYYVYDKISKKGDVALLGGDTETQAERWENIQVELIDEFGVSKEYKDYLSKMGEYVKNLNKAINGGDKSRINFANLYRIQAESKKIEGKDRDIIVIASKIQGYRVDPKTHTVKEIYKILKSVE